VTAAPTREQLVEHLVAARIAGAVGTPRESNLGNVHRMLARHPEYWFGLELDREWSFEDVVEVVPRRAGIDPDPARETGGDEIDPERCVEALDAVAARVADVAREGGSVLFATGHPTGLLALLLPLAASVRARGGRVVAPAAEAWVDVQGAWRRVRYVGGVATIGTGGDLLHTHSPDPMQAVLAAAAEPPDLVVADHGWAGAAGQAGLPTVGFADSNDPALFVGAEEGKLEVVVPLDDNVPPAAYEPLARYVLASRAWTSPNGASRFVPPVS
jgi:hypothetical protein